MTEEKVYTGWTKLSEENFNAETNRYKAEAAYPDGEKVSFEFSPEAGITKTGIEYIWRVYIEGKERPVNVKERIGDSWLQIYGCVSYDDNRWLNMRKNSSTSTVPSYTISFSKPAEAKVAKSVSSIEEIDKLESEESKKKDNLPF